jgi:hypothetical protein
MNHPSSSGASTTALLRFLLPWSEYMRNVYPLLFFLSSASTTVILELCFKNVRLVVLRYGISSAGWVSATCFPLLAVMENKKVESNVTATCAE